MNPLTNITFKSWRELLESARDISICENGILFIELILIDIIVMQLAIPMAINNENDTTSLIGLLGIKDERKDPRKEKTLSPGKRKYVVFISSSYSFPN